MLAKLATVLLLLGLSGLGQCQFPAARSDRTLIRNMYAFIADKGMLSAFAHECIDNSQKFQQQVTESPSIETLIDLIERLEDVIANTSEFSSFNTPDKVARMLLHR